MREILGMCIDLDRNALFAYQTMACACDDPEVSKAFEQLALDKEEHLKLWGSLLKAWEDGLIPDIADQHGIFQRVAEVCSETAPAVATVSRNMSCDEMLGLAANLEFFMLDPIFSEMIDLMQPSARAVRRSASSAHVLRLVDAIDAYHTEGTLKTFFTKALIRAFVDQQRLSTLSIYDELTGLYNRRGILGHLSQWLAWSGRYGHPVAVLLIDIDRFKDVNDVLGHVMGDHLLRQVADAVASVVRGSDLVGRFGGDEFMVIAPEATQDDLSRMAERLLAAVRHLAPGVADEPITVSVGGAWVDGSMPLSADSMIATAAASLYDAKAQGRDRSGLPRIPLTTR